MAQITPLTRELDISIHALREEGDPAHHGAVYLVVVFLSTPSARRATEYGVNLLDLTEFLSTPSVRRATKRDRAVSHCRHISIHALREEGDPPRVVASKVCWIFLSTPSVRRATLFRAVKEFDEQGISIHALREEGDIHWICDGGSPGISIHALREEGDGTQIIPPHATVQISIHALREEGDCRRLQC